MPEHHDPTHDPIDELTRFGAGLTAGAPGGPMSTTAAAARRRGDQIRRRRAALMTGGSMVAVAAIAVPIFVVFGGTPRSEQTPQPITQPPSPSSVVTHAAGPLTPTALLTDADTEYNGVDDWVRYDAMEGDGQASFNPCAEQSMSGLGATTVVRSDYDLMSDRNQPIGGASLTEVIGQFRTDAEASAAYDQVAGWLTECSRREAKYTEYRRLAEPRSIDVSGATAQISDSHYGPVDPALDPSPEDMFIMETGLLRKGNRLVVLTSVVVGQDYNFNDGTPVERMLPAAADRI